MKHLEYKILLALFIISLTSSFMLSIASQSEIQFCDINGGEGGGNTVYNSPYNYTFGIHNSYLGVAIFLTLSLITYSHLKKPTKQKRNLITYATVSGSLVALYFLYLQKFVLNAYCKYCLVVDISMIIALGIVAWKWKENA